MVCHPFGWILLVTQTKPWYSVRGDYSVNTRVWGSLQATLEAGKPSKYRKRCERSWVTRKHEEHSLAQCFPVHFYIVADMENDALHSASSRQRLGLKRNPPHGFGQPVLSWLHKDWRNQYCLHLQRVYALTHPNWCISYAVFLLPALPPRVLAP